MKTVFAMTLLLATMAQASYVDIPKDRLDDYKKATIQGAHESQKKGKLSDCKMVYGSLDKSTMVADYITVATSGQIQAEGAQPVLLFQLDQNNPRIKYVTTVVSSADYKEVLSLKLEKFDLNDINVGDLRNPRIEKAFELQWSFICE